MHVTVLLFILDILHCILAQVKGNIATIKMVSIRLSFIQQI